MHQWLFEVKGGHGWTLWTHRHIEGRTLGRAASVGFVNVLNTTPTHGSHTGSDSEKKSSLAELQTQSRCEGQLTKKTLRALFSTILLLFGHLSYISEHRAEPMIVSRY